MPDLKLPQRRASGLTAIVSLRSLFFSFATNVLEYRRSTHCSSENTSYKNALEICVLKWTSEIENGKYLFSSKCYFYFAGKWATPYNARVIKYKPMDLFCSISCLIY